MTTKKRIWWLIIVSLMYLNRSPHQKVKFFGYFWHYPAPDGIVINVNCQPRFFFNGLKRRHTNPVITGTKKLTGTQIKTNTSIYRAASLGRPSKNAFTLPKGKPSAVL
jgi:hypothetical protein